MNLTKTEILSADDLDLSRSRFNSLLKDQVLINLIILGDDENIRNYVQKADGFAQLTYYNIERKVIWIKDRRILKNEITELINKSNLRENISYDEILAVCLSPLKDTVCDIIKVDDRIDNIRLKLAFLKASSME